MRGISVPKFAFITIFIISSIVLLLDPLPAQESRSLEKRVTNLEIMVKKLKAEVDQLKGNAPSSEENKQKPPSEEVIKKAIAEQFKKQVPMSWAGSTMGGKNARIELIEIKQTGTFNDREGYWPVKARVKGTCTVESLMPGLTPTEKKAFDRIGDFKIYQDDYGSWKAYIEMMQ
jgi:hypothetical protein